MHSADEPPGRSPRDAAGSSVSIAILAAMACMPIVIAVGFLSDRPTGDAAAAVPGDISVLALRGGLDAAQRPAPPIRAGF